MTDRLEKLLLILISVLLAFTLTTAYQTYQNYSNNKKKEKAIIIAFSEDLKANLIIVNKNQTRIKNELKEIGKNTIMINSLDVLQSGFFDLLKIYLPQKLAEPETLSEIRNIYLITNGINGNIQSRETFRTNNDQTKQYFYHWIQKYDEILLGYMEALTKNIEIFSPKIEKYNSLNN